MKKVLVLLCSIFSLSSFGQDLSNYSYVVVPEKFSFLKEADQYQLNSLTKFLFEKNGFEAFIEGEEAYLALGPDRCDGLYADVSSDSGLFKTRLNVTLKDCRNQTVFVSGEGSSREKDYKLAYQEALREAFKSIEKLGYISNEVIVSGTPDLEEEEPINKERIVADSSSNVRDAKEINKKPNAELKKENSHVVNSSEGGEDPKVEQTSSEIKNDQAVGNEVSKGNSAQLIYTREGRNYHLVKTGKGFNLFQEGMTEPFATLISSSTGNNFVYSSMTSKGMAQIDENGNLIIEILKEDNSLETIIYQSRGQ